MAIRTREGKFVTILSANVEKNMVTICEGEDYANSVELSINYLVANNGFTEIITECHKVNCRNIQDKYTGLLLGDFDGLAKLVYEKTTNRWAAFWAVDGRVCLFIKGESTYIDTGVKFDIKAGVSEIVEIIDEANERIFSIDFSKAIEIVEFVKKS